MQKELKGRMEHEKNLIGNVRSKVGETGVIPFGKFKLLYLLQFKYTFENNYMSTFDYNLVSKEFQIDRYGVLTCILELFDLQR